MDKRDLRRVLAILVAESCDARRAALDAAVMRGRKPGDCPAYRVACRHADATADLAGIDDAGAALMARAAASPGRLAVGLRTMDADGKRQLRRLVERVACGELPQSDFASLMLGVLSDVRGGVTALSHTRIAGYCKGSAVERSRASVRAVLAAFDAIEAAGRRSFVVRADSAFVRVLGDAMAAMGLIRAV